MTTEFTMRPAREDDLPATLDVFYAALADLFERHNFDAPPPPRAYMEANWRHLLATGIFHMAERDGRAVAVCNALVRDRLWFLSGFWVLPEFQGRGVGRRLLSEVWREGGRQGAEIFFVWSSWDQRAVASYLRAGMLPGYQMLNFWGRAADVRLPGPPAGYAVEPLAVESAASIDETVRATRREVDHRFWLAQPGARGRLVVGRTGSPVGYYYLEGDAVAPAAWVADADAEAVLALACREAADVTGSVAMRVPGINHAALRFALAARMRYVSYAHFFTTAPFGRLERYLASGPVLF
ncbi:MAG TPA: GNAT family N-acetyltransferase [Pyrinomonadaceae bacterium]|nr:GNAT family N-acetyltransferase [Pyrinomonadaceae bacterium]